MCQENRVWHPIQNKEHFHLPSPIFHLHKALQKESVLFVHTFSSYVLCTGLAAKWTLAIAANFSDKSLEMTTWYPETRTHTQRGKDQRQVLKMVELEETQDLPPGHRTLQYKPKQKES